VIQIQKIRPEEIERESFRIIEEEFHDRTGHQKEDFSAVEFAVLQRIIHATGDFSFADTLRIHPAAIDSGLAAIRKGRNIYTDVTMVAAGIGHKFGAVSGGQLICRVGDEKVGRLARESGQTRAETALMLSRADDIGIVVVGNAPTALLAAMNMVIQGELSPDLIIGVPVGFVNAAESKELLLKQDTPFITVLGRRGGSPVAAAIVNALLKMN
jgi:precorrin-8X/cobalt-precorrin-8 methylmutase